MLVVLIIIEIQFEVIFIWPTPACYFLDYDVIQFEFVGQLVHAIVGLIPQIPNIRMHQTGIGVYFIFTLPCVSFYFYFEFTDCSCSFVDPILV